MDRLSHVDPEIARAIRLDTERQAGHLDLIASENLASEAVLEAAGCPLTNKYAEGYPGRRYYGGCTFVDEVERLAIERAKSLFGAEYVNVQPHSGTQANMGVLLSVMQPGDVLLGMDLSHGGHLSHGSPKSFSGQLFSPFFYGVDREREQIDMQEVTRMAREHRPKVVIAGASAYPRTLDFSAFREVAEEVGAYLLADIAHIAGLVAAGVHPSPVPFAHFITATTHKTLRGPRGGMIMASAEHARRLDEGIFPRIQGGPLMHIIAAKAVAFKEAMSSEFRAYQQQTVANARILGEALERVGFRLVSGGTDNHLLLLDLTPQGITGRWAEEALERLGITVNRNAIPFDPRPPRVASGIRLGTPTLTARGMREGEMAEVAQLIHGALQDSGEEKARAKIAARVKELCSQFPIYPGRLRDGKEEEA